MNSDEGTPSKAKEKGRAAPFEKRESIHDEILTLSPGMLTTGRAKARPPDSKDIRTAARKTNEKTERLILQSHSLLQSLYHYVYHLDVDLLNPVGVRCVRSQDGGVGGFRGPEDVIDCGNSGTGVRLITPVGPMQLDIAYGLKSKDIRLHMNVGFVF